MHVLSTHDKWKIVFPVSFLHQVYTYVVIKRLICLNAQPSFDLPVGDILLCMTSDTKGLQGLMEYSILKFAALVRMLVFCF